MTARRRKSTPEEVVRILRTGNIVASAPALGSTLGAGMLFDGTAKLEEFVRAASRRAVCRGHASLRPRGEVLKPPRRPLSPEEAARDRARQAEVDDLRKQFERELVLEAGAAKAAEFLGVIEENTDGEFFHEVLLGQVDVGDPYGEHPTLPIVLAKVLRARHDEQVAQRAAEMKRASHANGTKIERTGQKRERARQLARRIGESAPEAGPISGQLLYDHLAKHPEDLAEVLGVDPTEVSPAEDGKRVIVELIPTPRTLRGWLRK